MWKKNLVVSKRIEIWEINMGRYIEFSDAGSKARILKIVVNQKTKNLITAYPF